eukprot:jgi/Psemu1/3606/gm1.3606_g
MPLQGCRKVDRASRGKAGSEPERRKAELRKVTDAARGDVGWSNAVGGDRVQRVSVVYTPEVRRDDVDRRQRCQTGADGIGRDGGDNSKDGRKASHTRV